MKVEKYLAGIRLLPVCNHQHAMGDIREVRDCPVHLNPCPFQRLPLVDALPDSEQFAMLLEQRADAAKVAGSLGASCFAPCLKSGPRMTDRLLDIVLLCARQPTQQGTSFGLKGIDECGRG
jgi:hypothetical protein